MKEKNITQKQSLTDYQKKLIELNYNEIKNLIRCNLGNPRFFIRNGASKKEMTLEALSFCADVALEYNPSLCEERYFARWAASRCIFRMIDYYRKFNNYAYLNIAKNKVIEKLEQQSLKKLGYIDESFIIDGLIKLGKNNKNTFQKEYVEKISLNSKGFKEIEDQRDFFSTIDKEDLINYLNKKSENFFFENNDSAKIRKKIIKEYIIPRLNNEEHKSLSAIAEESNRSNGNISQIIRDDNIKSFISSIYKDIDKNGKPITDE